MVYTFRGLYTQAMRYLDESGDTGTTRDLVKDAVNRHNQLRSTMRAWPFMIWDSPETFTTTVGEHVYPLHEEFGIPLYFYNVTTKRYMVEVPSRQLLERGLRWNDDTGSAENFMYWGHTLVKNQPSSPSVVTIVSTNGGDTGTNYDIVVRGIDTSDAVVAELITPTGITPASGSVTFKKILMVTKSQSWNGVLTVSTNSGAVTNVVVNPLELGRQYRQIYINESPVASETIEYRFRRKPQVLINDYDIPDIPAPWCQVLVYDALLELATYNTDISAADIAIWTDQRERWENALDFAFADTQTLGGGSRTVLDFSATPYLFRRPTVEN